MDMWIMKCDLFCVCLLLCMCSRYAILSCLVDSLVCGLRNDALMCVVDL